MKYRSNSILAFTPQNSIGEKVLLQAIYFSKVLQMRIFALQVPEKSNLLSRKLQTKKIELLQNKANEKLTGFIEESIQKNLPDNIIPRTKYGDLFTTLLSETKKGGYEFMVVDKSEEILKKTKLNKLVNHAHCPVLVTNINVPIKTTGKIIIPIDITQKTKKRLLWATFFAKKLDAKIQIVSALNIDMEETKSLAYKNADKIKTMLQERGVECEIKMLKVHNQPNHKVILEHIEKESPRMVIIRTHQESIFANSRIGQFVSEIVHNCQMPVFTVSHSSKPVHEI